MSMKLFATINFYILWLIAVMLAPDSLLWLLFLFLLTALQIFLCLKQFNFKLKISLFFLLGLISWCVDTLISVFQLIDFKGDHFIFFAPYWLLFLWLAFIAVFIQCFHRHLQHVQLWVIAGALALPFNYYLGCKLGAGVFLQPLYAMICYILWGGGLFLLICLLNSMISRYDNSSQKT
ncbi:MAG: hypothetical protein CMF49_06630 [Legionellales bacterium]|nr:hypothetical protein [Legionellales bacterium]|tara:strand:+ start:2651 stop:3184 length:534 start_codon:yes stop_codon:yes gene_type:complete